MTEKLAPLRSFGGKLYAVFATLVILVAGLGVTGYVQLSRVGDISASVVDTAAAHSLAQDLAVGLADLDSDLDDFIVVGDGVSRGAIEADLASIEDTLTALAEQIVAGTGIATDLDLLISETTSLSDHAQGLITATGITNGERNRMIAEIFNHVDAVRTLFNEFNADSLARVDGEIVSQTNILSGLSVQLMLLVAATLAILVFTSLYVRSTVRSIGAVTDTALAIAAGDLEQVVPVHRRDEIGLLAGAFNNMTGQIRELVDSLEHRVVERTVELSDANDALTGEIAERRHAEAELRRSKEFAETVLNSMSESIAIIDVADLTIVGANKVFIEASDVSTAEELLGLTCYGVTHGRSDQCCAPDDVCPLIDLESGASVATVEHVHYQASGEAHHVEVSVSPIHDEHGHMTRVVHVSHDITERKRAEVELRDYSARLETALPRTSARPRRSCFKPKSWKRSAAWQPALRTRSTLRSSTSPTTRGSSGTPSAIS